MTTRFSVGLLITAGLATLITLVIAWPVVLHPATMIYGQEILGRHADPYVTIVQFGSASAEGTYGQPLTDGFGWLLARVLPPVAAFNLVVLLSFPLSAMTAYGLGRYLTRSHRAALVAALAYAFSPWHLAHAAYHPHVAQTQWLPLFVLALVAMVERMSAWRVLGAVGAAAAVLLSNVDAGWIGLLMAPVILATFWGIRSDADRNPWPFLGPAVVVAAIAAVAAAVIWYYQPAMHGDGSRVGYGLEDIGFYRARWWSYLTPAIDNPLLFRVSFPIFDQSDVTMQLTEMQLYLGYALLALAAAALPVSIGRWNAAPRWRAVPALLAIAIVAGLVSLGPTGGTCLPSTLAPACLIHQVAPSFGVYARVGALAQLMLALAAGFGASLLTVRTTGGRVVAIGVLALAVIRYWPLPARAHDVLPTTAHRWLASSPDEGRILDCYPGSAAESTIPWLMNRDMVFLDDRLPGCAQPNIGITLAGMQISQVLVRHGSISSKLLAPLPQGITPVQEFADADLYAVSQTPPPIVTVLSPGFYGHEHDGDDWWRWMSPSGSWTVRNTTSTPRRVSLTVNLQPIGAPRRIAVTMDRGTPTTIALQMNQQDVTLGPWTLSPGDHQLTFVADGDPVRPAETQGGNDQRALAVSFRNERWTETP